ncbi:MAG: amidohydrolase, partial [Candidatus Bathyarchaeia archaeon]
AKRAMEEHGLKGTLKFFGEPAEKVCGSKAVHAAKGYFDDFDASICYHPSGVNNVIYSIPFASYWSQVYTFETINPENWFRPTSGPIRRGGRIPAALDAVCLMYTTTKYTKEAILPHVGGWSLNEFLMVGGQCTSDNVPPKIGQIQYAFRSPALGMQEQIDQVLDNNARGVGLITGTRVTKRIVARTRVGLANCALSEIVYENLKLSGPPKYGEEAKKIGRQIQENLGLEPMEEPFAEACQEILSLEETDRRSRSSIPPWVETRGSDDYVEYTWTCPGVRFHTARAGLRPYPDFTYPGWTRIAMGGIRETIDPMIFTCSKTTGASIVELITNPDKLRKCQEEFKERTGGGVGGSKWVAPLLPKDFLPPIDLPWPEYVTTVRGTEWSLTIPGPAKEYKVLYEGL